MTHDHSQHDHGASPRTNFWQSRAFIVFLGFAAIALVMSWQEHRAHILGALPYLFLLACPFMHVFMHGSHGGHGDQHNDQGKQPTERITGDNDGGKQ